MDELTIEDFEDAIRECDNWHDFHQVLAHKMGIVTRTDRAYHIRNLARVKEIKNPRSKYHFIEGYHKPSFVEDEFAEFREGDGNE